jgi:hypothetical protein
MHAVFLVTAAHLQYLQPDNISHPEIVLEYFSQALSGFRIALDTLPGDTAAFRDALRSSSMLLLQYSWAASVPDDAGESDGWDALLGLYIGLRRLLLQLGKDESRFNSSMIYSPRLSIEQYLGGRPVPLDIEYCFNHVVGCVKISDDLLGLIDCASAAQRLTTIWSALKLGVPALESSHIFLDVARYLFTWPIFQSAGFLDLMNKDNGRCQAIMLYYFAGVIRFRSHRFWWMRRRAVFMFDSIFDRLKDKCELCTGMARTLRGEEDL